MLEVLIKHMLYFAWKAFITFIFQTTESQIRQMSFYNKNSSSQHITVPKHVVNLPLWSDWIHNSRNRMMVDKGK